MRLPIPDRLNPRAMLIFILVLFVAQQLEGTDFVFSMLTALYIALWTLAFNVSGGLTYPSGSFIFFNGLFSSVFGEFLKVFFVEPGERNLPDANGTMVCYCIGMAMMAVAATFARGFRPARGLLTGFDTLAAIKQASIACLVFGFLLYITGGSNTSSSGSVVTAIRQLNRFPQMAIMLATSYEIARSRGKRSANWIVYLSVGFTFFVGLLQFSKGGILVGFTAWGVTAILLGYNFSKTQIISAALGGFFMVYYLTPYSQYVRVYQVSSKTENIATAIKYLSNLNETRRLYLELIENYSIGDEPHMFDKRQAFLDRLIVMPADAALINYTDKGNIYGLAPTIAAYANIVPHFIWHDKSSVNAGNQYGRELGEIADDDYTTGISFSPTADAYHQAGWLGLLLLLPIDMFIYFMICDSLVGSAKYTPWPLIMVLDAAQTAPDGLLDGAIYMATFGALSVVFIYAVVKYVVPFLLDVVRRKPPPTFNATPAPVLSPRFRGQLPATNTGNVIS